MTELELDRSALPEREGEPVYRRIVQLLTGYIQAGTLREGAQLPTVRALAEQLGVAQGTVKRAYDELERQGILTKAAGRGSFVAYRPPQAQSAQEAAALAADQLLERLHTLGLSDTQMEALLTERLRLRRQQRPQLRAALVECNPEILAQLRQQLGALEGIGLHPVLLDRARQHPERLASRCDVIITTAEHASELTKMTRRADKVAKIALRLTPQSIAAIVKLTPGAHVGILTHSLRFGALLQEHCRSYALGAVLDEPALLQPGAAFEAYLRGKSVILVPEGYENDCTPEVLGALRRFARRGSVVPCAYRIDEGSRIYLTERLERLRSGLTAERAAWA
mgnify:FL=1